VNPLARRRYILLAIASIVVPALAGSAQAAFSVAPVRTFGGMGSFYGLAPYGTIWATPAGENSRASFVHYDDEGDDLGDGFSVSRNNYFPLGIGYYGNRVYVTVSSSFGGRLISYQANSADPAHDLLFTDAGTDERIGSNQAALRVFSDGSMAVALGQADKVGTLDGKDLTKEHPFYPQAFHGGDQPKLPRRTAVCPRKLRPRARRGPGLWRTGKMWEPTRSRRHQAPDGVDYPNDIAFGLGGIYISEGNEITHYNTVANPGATLDLRCGVGPGSGAGQLSGPESIVVQPSTGWV
jgi:hypothetical protein